MYSIQPQYTANNNAPETDVCAVHVNSFSYLSWQAWRVICFKGWTQNLINVCTIVKSISTWSNSPGSKLPTFTWCTLQCLESQGSAEDSSWAFSKHSVSRLTYVRFCWPSPTGNWYLCSEQAQHRARTINSDAEIWWERFTVFWEECLHKHPHG
jgi:hypothetical protein